MSGGLGSDALRAEFPTVARQTYLASHSLGAVPRRTAEALREYYETWERDAILAWDGPFLDAIRAFSARLERLLSAPAGSVLPMENVTRGFAAIASAFDWRSSRNRVVMTDLEFSTSYPFWQGLARFGAELVIVRSDDGIAVPTERVLQAIDERTAIVPTSHVFFRSGAVQDLREIARHAHAHGALVCGDGYQAVGTLPVSVAELDVDFYVGGSHKWLCGGPGAGFLYVRPELARSLEPAFAGWFALAKPFEYAPGTVPERHAGINRFYGGTPAVPALYAAREGHAWVERLGLAEIRRHSLALAEQVLTEADRRRFRVRSPREHAERSGMVCLDFDGAQAAAARLCAEGIIVDYRPNCGIRVSPHFYSNAGDIDRFFAALDRLR